MTHIFRRSATAYSVKALLRMLKTVGLRRASRNGKKNPYHQQSPACCGLIVGIYCLTVLGFSSSLVQRTNAIMAAVPWPSSADSPVSCLVVPYRPQLWKRGALGGGLATHQQAGGLGAEGRRRANVHDSVQFCDRHGEGALLVSAVAVAPCMRFVWGGWAGCESSPGGGAFRKCSPLVQLEIDVTKNMGRYP